MARSPTIIWDIVEEHLDEAEFLWGQWERALASPRYTLSEVAEGPEERLGAHLDALAQAGEKAARELLLPALGAGNPNRAAAATAALVAAGRLELLRSAVPETPEVGRAVGRALGLALPVGGEAALLPWLRSGEAPARMAVFEALSFRDAVPPEELRSVDEHSEPRLLAAALLAAGAAGTAGSDHRELVEWGLASPHPEVRDAAIGAGLRLGLRSALVACRAAVEAGTGELDLPLLVLAISGERGDLDRIAGALDVPALSRGALFAAGVSGWPRAGDLCVSFLVHPCLGALAGEAISAISGLRVDGQYAAPAPEGYEEGDDEHGRPTPAEVELPWPLLLPVERWWKEARSRFADGQRYVEGRPWELGTLWQVFRGGPTRRRHALGLELAVRSHGELRVETRARAADQLRAQAALRVPSRADHGRSLDSLLKP